MPTMAWNESRTTFTGGRSVGGTVSSPWTVAFGSWNANSDRSRGISIPYTTLSPSYQPSRCSGAPAVVRASPSMAASFTGCCLATSRAAQSPISGCTIEAIAAAESAIASAVRS